MIDPLVLRNSLKTSTDEDYSIGQISVFPEQIDTWNTLYEVTNNAETMTTQTLTFTGHHIFVEDASGFPPSGLLRIGPPPGTPQPGEIIYYAGRTNKSFSNLVRGLVGTRQNKWNKGSYVTCSVMAEHHNAIKDAIYNLESFLGTKYQPHPESLHARLKHLEFKHLSPKPTFRAYPVVGRPPLAVRFQNFSGSNFIRFLWDFGDGNQSVERNPIHTFTSERHYSIRLHAVTEDGAQGIVVKNDYIRVSREELELFFYVEHVGGTTYLLIDQSDGDITQRYWAFGDGTGQLIENPNIHTIEHTYAETGTYYPSLLLVFQDQSTRTFSQELVVS